MSSLQIRLVSSLLALVLSALVSRFVAAQEPRGVVAEAMRNQPGLLPGVEQERRVLAGKVRAEVDSALSSARRLMGENPAQVEQDLKLILEGIDQTPELDADLRGQLRRQVTSAIREARIKKVAADQRAVEALESKAAARDQERLNAQLANDQQRLKQLVERFNSLLDEKRFETAVEQLAPDVQRLAPGSTIESSVTVGGGLLSAVHTSDETRRARDSEVVRTLASVERSAKPFSDDQPIAFLQIEQWQEITTQRAKYKAVELHPKSAAEQRIESELNKSTNFEAVEMPLKDVMLYFAETHNIPIVFSTKKLAEASIGLDTPVTKTIRGVTLRSALRLILKDVELSYLVQDEVLQITTPEDAAAQLTEKVYPVGDLVIPIRLPTNIFGLGGTGGMNGGPGIGNPLGGQMPGGANAGLPGMNFPGAAQNPGVNIF